MKYFRQPKWTIPPTRPREEQEEHDKVIQGYSAPQELYRPEPVEPVKTRRVRRPTERKLVVVRKQHIQKFYTAGLRLNLLAINAEYRDDLTFEDPEWFRVGVFTVIPSVSRFMIYDGPVDYLGRLSMAEKFKQLRESFPELEWDWLTQTLTRKEP